MARQFVVQLDNRPGELAQLARALAARGIDLRDIGGVGAGDLGCAFLTTSDDAATREVLHGLGHPCIEGAPEAGVNVCGTLMVGRTPGVVD